MRLVDFLIQLLTAQAQTLQRLAAFFGEEELFQLLEDAGETPLGSSEEFQLDSQWFVEPPASQQSSGYAELEGAVRELGLPSILEFHLWAYPFYRTFIESSVHLKSQIRTSSSKFSSNGPDPLEILVNEAIHQAKAWHKTLAIRPGVSVPAENAAMLPWIKFRSEVFKKAGKRSMGLV